MASPLRVRPGPFVESARCPDCRRKQTPARHRNRSQKCQLRKSRKPPPQRRKRAEGHLLVSAHTGRGRAYTLVNQA